MKIENEHPQLRRCKDKIEQTLSVDLKLFLYFVSIFVICSHSLLCFFRFQQYLANLSRIAGVLTGCLCVQVIVVGGVGAVPVPVPGADGVLHLRPGLPRHRRQTRSRLMNISRHLPHTQFFVDFP